MLVPCLFSSHEVVYPGPFSSPSASPERQMLRPRKGGQVGLTTRAAFGAVRSGFCLDRVTVGNRRLVGEVQ
jgi:hypothetical protein